MNDIRLVNMISDVFYPLLSLIACISVIRHNYLVRKKLGGRLDQLITSKEDQAYHRGRRDVIFLLLRKGVDVKEVL